MTSRIKVRCFPLVLALAGLFVLGACSEGNAKKKTEPPAVPVTIAKAQQRDVPVALSVVGRAEAFESVVLRSRVDGQVAEVLFTEGQHVRQGDVLIRLDPTDFAAKLNQAEASAARDQALAAKSQSDTARYSALKDRNFVSEEKVNDVRTNEAAAAANLRASRAAVELARLQLSYTTIRAPITGLVGARVVFPGSAVKTNETILATINRVRPLLVAFSLPEKHLPRLRATLAGSSDKKMKVDITLPSDTTQHFEGELRFIDNAVDAATGTILLKAQVDNADEKLTPGQFLNLRLILETLPQAVTIPTEAVQQGADGTFTFVVKEGGSVEVRKLEVATSEAGVSAIAKGLSAGETVVTDGQLRLTAGVKVKVRENGAPAPAAPAGTAPAAADK